MCPNGTCLMSAPNDYLAFLMGSQARLRTLEVLAEEPRSSDELRAAVDVSPATVVRTLDQLQARGLVTRTPDRRQYRATELGVAVLAEVHALRDAMETARRWQTENR